MATAAAITKSGISFTQFVDVRVMADLAKFAQAQGVTPRTFSELGRMMLTAARDLIVPDAQRTQTQEDAIKLLAEHGLQTVQFDTARKKLVLNTKMVFNPIHPEDKSHDA